MKDCSKTEIYLQERTRMCKLHDCQTCAFSAHRITPFAPCNGVEDNNPLKAIEIVQKWSDEHPEGTDTNVGRKVKVKRVRM